MTDADAEGGTKVSPVPARGGRTALR